VIGFVAGLRRATLAARALLVGATAVAGLHGCGLEATVSLNPPDYLLTDSLAAYFTIRIDEDNDEDELRGIEFYYRFYPDAVSVNGGLATYSELVGSGFRRLASVTDTVNLIVRPLLLIDPPSKKGLWSDIKVDFGPLSLPTPAEPEMSATPPPPDETPDEYEGGLILSAFHFRRGVSDLDLTFKSFLDDVYAATDQDIDNELGLVPGGPYEVYLALYALSFGKVDLTIDTYSRATFLLSVRLFITIVE